MRLEYIVDWPWAVILSPLICGTPAVLCFLCFLIPGFLQVVYCAAVILGCARPHCPLP